MNENDKELLHKQAYEQAEKFEVLNKRDVASMSRVSLPELKPALLLALTILVRSSGHSMNAVTTCAEPTSLCAQEDRNSMAA
jgi:hypothetical protein